MNWRKGSILDIDCMNNIIVAYVPVIHEGYRRFFENHSRQADSIFIFGRELIKQYRQLEKDINALPPETIKKFIESLGFFKYVGLLNLSNIEELKGKKLIMPDEDVSRSLAVKYFQDSSIIWGTIFLRWDKHKTMETRPVEMDQKISRNEFDREIVQRLKKEAEKSSDFWRRIASCIISNEKILLMAHNEQLPSEQSPYIEGDPRNNFHKGVAVELSTAIHSEAQLIAEAARQGISLEGTSIYVTVFPCPPCAKMIAFSGIKKLYYAGGYSMLNQERILRSKGTKIIFIDANR